MRRSASTVVVLAGPAPGEVLAALGRSMNVALIRPEEEGLVLAREDTEGPDFHLGPLRSARAHRVVLVPEQEPGRQAAGVLHALGSLRHGPWWPGLDEVIEAARRFYPDSLGATGPGSATPAAGRVRAG